MSYAKNAIKTVLVLAIFVGIGISILASTQASNPVNATLYPEAAAAQVAVNAGTWNALLLVPPLFIVIVAGVVMKYLDLF